MLPRPWSGELRRVNISPTVRWEIEVAEALRWHTYVLEYFFPETEVGEVTAGPFVQSITEMELNE